MLSVYLRHKHNHLGGLVSGNYWTCLRRHALLSNGSWSGQPMEVPESNPVTFSKQSDIIFANWDAVDCMSRLDRPQHRYWQLVKRTDWPSPFIIRQLTFQDYKKVKVLSVQCSLTSGIALFFRRFQGSCSLEGSNAPSVCPSGKNNTWLEMSMQNWWNNTDREKPKYLSQCHFIPHKSHMDWIRIESGLPQCQTGK